jgi:7-cyano-7-deazaguanine synthase
VEGLGNDAIMDAVVLLSGGLDSYTAAALAAERGFALNALTIKYGQRHARELEAACRVAASLRVRRHLEVAVDLAAIGGSALTTSLDVPKDRDVDDHGTIPSTYVPARNTVFLSLALAWAWWCSALSAACRSCSLSAPT